MLFAFGQTPSLPKQKITPALVLSGGQPTSQPEPTHIGRPRPVLPSSRASTFVRLARSILDGRSQVESLDGHIQLLRRQITGLRWFWHGKKRRELQSQLEPLEQQQEKSSAELVALEEQRESLASAILPDISGMSIEGKRLINTAMLAYAQQLLMRLGEDGLALMAKDANLKRVGDVRYGSSEECQQWLQKLQLALRDLHDRPRQLGNLKLHIQRLRANAFYRSDHETEL